MGYVFDAINKASQGERPPDDAAEPTPAPEPPATDARPDAPSAPPAAEARDIETEAIAALSSLKAAIDGILQPAASVDAEPEPAEAAPAEPAAPFAEALDAQEPEPEGDAVDDETAAFDEQLLSLDLDERIVVLTDPSSIMAEQYRGIRTRLLAHWENRKHLVHTITSATPKEGKTLTTLNLGAAFGELAHRRTLMIECDLRMPMFASMLHIAEQTPGLIQVLHGEATFDEAVCPSCQSNVSLMLAGGRMTDEAIRMLSGVHMTEVLRQARNRFDHVIIDTPPVLELADAGVVGAQSDDVLLVVRLNHTPRYVAVQAQRTLQSYNAAVTGTILTHQDLGSAGYAYRYGYRYYAGATSRRAMRRRLIGAA